MTKDLKLGTSHVTKLTFTQCDNILYAALKKAQKQLGTSMHVHVHENIQCTYMYIHENTMYIHVYTCTHVNVHVQ